MNNRLREIYRSCKSAEALASQDGFKSADVLLGSEVEKFAELIVKECLDILANADIVELEAPDPEDVLYVACKQVKEHFGVEE